MAVEPETKWQPIADLPDNWREWVIPELSSLAGVWMEQYDRLKESQAVKEFNDRLRREWSIETGILERLYTIDRGITQLLIEQGIDAALIPHGATDRPPEEVIRILQDHSEALEGVFSFVAQRLSLTTSYIRQLHQVLTRHQLNVEALDQFGKLTTIPLAKGEWKKWPNNPTRPDGSIHEYCPPLQVAGEMERLLDFYHSHQRSVPPEVLSAWLHHRFTQIHPFHDGNGRVARALATIVFLQAGWFPLVVNRDQRGDYIVALEAADGDDLGPLVRLFGQNAKRAFVRALSLSEDVLRGDAVLSLARLVDGLVSVYKARRRSPEEKYQRLEALAEQLSGEASSVLEETAREIKSKFAIVDPPVISRVYASHDHNAHYYTAQIISVAKDLNYFANLARPRRWVRLHLIDGQKTHIVFSFHYLGKTNQGVAVCVAFVYFPETKLETRPESGLEADPELYFGETRRICSEPFTFSYTDETRLDGLKSDFRKWLNAAVAVGLAEWGQRL
ncbi:MAG: Fic family protein [Chloroflexota bacterium]